MSTTAPAIGERLGLGSCMASTSSSIRCSGWSSVCRWRADVTDGSVNHGISDVPMCGCADTAVAVAMDGGIAVSGARGQPEIDRRDGSHPLRRARDYRTNRSRTRLWSRPERSYRLSYRRHPLVTFVSTLIAVILPGAVVFAGSGTSDFGRPEQPQSMSVLTGLTIPWAAGGLRYNAVGKLEDFAGEWPSADVKAVRFWDTRTAWLNIEPAQDQWEFSHLDENF
ncbi:MAG: hypothetical protein WC005_10570, partial [Candidatus Nanopelagicales bacterium]